MRCLVWEREWSPKRRAEVPELSHVDVVEGDLRDPSTCERAVKDVETVFNLASARTPRHVREFHQVNVDGTRSVAEAALAAGVGRFVHVSSISVHGHNASPERPFVETDPPSPRTPYARSKLAGEHVVSSLAARGLPSVVLRPGPFYGPEQSPAFDQLMRLVSDRQAPRSSGAPAMRSLAHVDNVLDALLLAEASDVADGRQYLIGDAHPYTTDDLLETVADALSLPLRTQALPWWMLRVAAQVARAMEVSGLNPAMLTTAGEFARHSFCSITRAADELGYAPRRTLAEGIREAVAERRARSRGEPTVV